MSASATSSIYSYNPKRRYPSHSEPTPATYLDDRAPSARLNRAIQSSNIHLVRRLLDSSKNSDGTPLDPRNPDPVTKKTSLILATELGELEICKLLIEQYAVEADAVSRDLENNTVIHLAAAEGLDELISLYHSHYPFVLDWANSDGMTALHVASQKGHESTVSLLLDLQADVELTDNEGNTCLHYAAGWGHLKIVLLLIDRGSPFWAKNNQTFTASDYAYSFSIQSALQESARAHFESKKSQQRHHRQQRDRERDKERTLRTATGASTGASVGASGSGGLRSGSPAASLRPHRIQVEDASAPRSSSMPLVVTTPPAHKVLHSPSPTTSSLRHALPSLSASQSASKPLASPTHTVGAARTVSHLISKDLEAIEGFRTRTSSLASSIMGGAPPAAGGAPSYTDSPASSAMDTSRLLPLQLVLSSSAGASGTPPGVPTLRARSSTGTLGAAEPNNRVRAGSTDSSDAALSGLGYREGLSRLKYLRSGSSVGGSLGRSTQVLAPLPLERVPGSPGQGQGSSSGTGRRGIGGGHHHQYLHDGDGERHEHCHDEKDELECSRELNVDEGYS